MMKSKIAYISIVLLFPLLLSAQNQIYEFSRGHGDIKQIREANLFIMESIQENNWKKLKSFMGDSAKVKTGKLKKGARQLAKNYHGKTKAMIDVIDPKETTNAWFNRTYFTHEKGGTNTVLFQVRIVFEKGTSKKIKSLEFVCVKDIEKSDEKKDEVYKDITEYSEIFAY